MKKLFLIILLLTISLPAQVTRYVNKNAVGGVYDGLSWDTGWRTFTAINWGELTPGSTLFISGGPDSIKYYEQLDVQTSGSPGKLVTIRAGLTSGHNGRVIIDAEGVRDNCVNVTGYNSSGHIRFVKIEARRSNGMGNFFISGETPNNITCVYIDSCRATDQRNHGSIFIRGDSGTGNVMWEHTQGYSDSIFVRWCYLKGVEQYPPPAADFGEDVIFLQSSKNIFIYGNTIINNNAVTINHSDAIQCIYMEDVYVWHNWMYTSGPNPSLPNQVMMYEAMRGDIVLYGNVLYSPNQTSWMNNFIDKNDNLFADIWKKYYVINNVFYGGDDGDTGYNLFNCQTDTAHTYNNIFQNNVSYSSETLIYCWDDTTGHDPWEHYSAPWGWTNGNLYGDRLNQTFYGWTMTEFNSRGGEPIGTPSQRYRVDPLFVDVNRSGGDSGEDADFHLQSSSPARDKGYNAQSIIEGFNIPDLEWKDMDGKTLDATPDIGPYQYATAGKDTTVTVTFANITGAELNSYHIGKACISGDADTIFHAWAKTSADTFKVNYNGTKTISMVEVEIGDTIYSYNVASNLYSTKTTNSVMVSGTQRDFDVTTKAEPGGGGTLINGGWVRGSNGRKIYDKNGKAIILRP